MGKKRKHSHTLQWIEASFYRLFLYVTLVVNTHDSQKNASSVGETHLKREKIQIIIDQKHEEVGVSDYVDRKKSINVITNKKRKVI